MKLYRVNCRGMCESYGVSFVVADDAAQAYSTVREYLDRRDVGFGGEREMASVELLAEEGDYPDCERRLFLPVEVPK